jgi:hypothetical protein
VSAFFYYLRVLLSGGSWPRCRCDGGKAGAIDYGHAPYCPRF